MAIEVENWNDLDAIRNDLPDQNVVISPHDKVDIGQHIIDNSRL